jgi:hypothetical protein
MVWRMKKRLIFWSCMAVYLLLLVAVASYALSSVKELLVHYEAAQPEVVVESELKKLQSAAKNGTLSEIMDFSESAFGEDFDLNSPLNQSYVDLIAQSELTYVLSTEDFSSTGLVYNIQANGTTVAKITLESSNERTELIVFSSSDWSVLSIEPVQTHVVELTLPSDLTVFANGVELTGSPCEEETGKLYYYVSGLSDLTVTVSDHYGHSLDLSQSTDLSTKSYTFTLPSNYTLTVAGQELSPDPDSSVEFSQFTYVKEYYSDLPTKVSYSFTCLLTENSESDIAVTDNLGNPVTLDLSSGIVEITDFVSLSALPDSIQSEINVIAFGETWSKFMSKDLTGKNYGFSQVAAYLISDSYLYNVAYSWATGVDITFTSAHTLKNPPFTEETVTNFISYGEDCFSCDLHLIKHMLLTRTGASRDDEMNCTIYFVKYDDTDDGVDNPRWCAVDLQDIIA